MPDNGNDPEDSDHGNGVVKAAVRPASDVSVCIANLGLHLHAIAVDLREAAQRIDQLERFDRRVLCRKVSQQLGELGDNAHEARRVIEAIWRDDP